MREFSVAGSPAASVVHDAAGVVRSALSQVGCLPVVACRAARWLCVAFAATAASLAEVPRPALMMQRARAAPVRAKMRGERVRRLSTRARTGGAVFVGWRVCFSWPGVGSRASGVPLRQPLVQGDQ